MRLPSSSGKPVPRCLSAGSGSLPVLSSGHPFAPGARVTSICSPANPPTVTSSGAVATRSGSAWMLVTSAAVSASAGIGRQLIRANRPSMPRGPAPDHRAPGRTRNAHCSATARLRRWSPRRRGTRSVLLPVGRSLLSPTGSASSYTSHGAVTAGTLHEAVDGIGDRLLDDRRSAVREQSNGEVHVAMWPLGSLTRSSSKRSYPAPVVVAYNSGIAVDGINLSAPMPSMRACRNPPAQPVTSASTTRGSAWRMAR